MQLLSLESLSRSLSRALGGVVGVVLGACIVALVGGTHTPFFHLFFQVVCAQRSVATSRIIFVFLWRKRVVWVNEWDCPPWCQREDAST